MGVLALWFWSRKAAPKNSLTRAGATASLCLMLSEAAIGAGLVLLKLVAQDTSLLRAGYLSIHLLNTFLLLAALTVMAWASRRPQASLRNLRRSADFSLLMAGLAGTLMLGITGGIAALGDTLFPSTSLQTGLARDFMPGVHFLLRLRVLHPALAILVAMGLIVVAVRASANSVAPSVRLWAKALLVVVAVQLAVGAWNLLWLAPIALQLIHLVMADALWVVLLLFTLSQAVPEELQ
jgi:heme A synthase